MFSTDLAANAANLVMGFRDKGWDNALKEAGAVLLNPAILQVADMDKDPDFMTVFGYMSPQASLFSAPPLGRNDPPFAMAV